MHVDADAMNKTGLDLVLTDLDVGLTLLDVADASGIAETKQRNYQNAQKAYDTVLKFLKKLSPDAQQKEVIDAKLAALKSRLIAAGQHV